MYNKVKNAGNYIYGWAGNTANDIWQIASKASSNAVLYAGQTTSYASEITNKIWQKTAEAGPVLQQVIAKAYQMTTSSEAKQLLNECQKISATVSRILIRVYAVNALDIIKNRAKQGAEIGLRISSSPECVLIGTALGAAFGLCEVIYKLYNDDLLRAEAKDLFTRCQTIVFLVKKAYNADMSPLAASIPPVPAPVSTHPFVKNPRPITFGKIPGYDDTNNY
ncbi:MAG: hypothetical protein IKI30_01910 [Oxalobacter sp.]|nr:hypothetical protein [Oxalobacter sp.]